MLRPIGKSGTDYIWSLHDYTMEPIYGSNFWFYHINKYCFSNMWFIKHGYTNIK